tara:strand:- start:713 stop:1123 length:411 start_codon:yes stop_codon:yes gene_type:complete
MSRENEQELMSFTEDGQRWLQCKSCYEYQKVEENTKAITCSKCTMINTLKLKPMDTFFAKKHKKTGRPAGWHWMAEFVDKDGTVYHRGKEQPDLKGTLKPTKVKPRKKKKKLSADDKLHRDIKNWKKRKKAKRSSK